MKKFFLILLAVAVIGALILGGCAKKTPSTTITTTQTSTTTTTPHKVLKIGCVTGLNTSTGVEEKKWLDLFAKLINEQGGWKIGADTYNVDVIFYDSQNDPAKGKSLLEKLVLQDGVKFVLGTPTANAATDAEVTEPNKVICLGMDFVGIAADLKVQYYWDVNGFTFTSGYFYIIYKDMEAKGMKSYASLKSDDMIGRITDGMSNTVWTIAAPSVKHAGTVFYDSSTSDFGSVATKLMNLHPDVIDCNYNAFGGAGPYNALYDAGYKGVILPQLAPSILEAIRTHCGKAFMEGWEMSISDPTLIMNQDPATLVLIDAYIKEYGTLQTDGVSFVSNWFILKDAIDNTQSVDADVIKAYLSNQPQAVRTLDGYCQLFARPDVGNLRTVSGAMEAFLGIVKDGKLVPFEPVTIKDEYLASILCNHLVDVYKAYWEQYGYPKFPAGETSTLKFSDLGITGQD